MFVYTPDSKLMLTKDQVVKLLQEHLAFLASEFGIRRIGLFGSFAKGHPSEHSDIDIIVEFERPIGLRFIDLVEYLEKLFGRKVDILTLAGVQGIRRKTVAKSIAESVVYV
jgi:predicted nucleotidyltransferase